MVIVKKPFQYFMHVLAELKFNVLYTVYKSYRLYTGMHTINRIHYLNNADTVIAESMLSTVFFFFSSIVYLDILFHLMVR